MQTEINVKNVGVKKPGPQVKLIFLSITILVRLSLNLQSKIIYNSFARVLEYLYYVAVYALIKI